jgi:uncharacterized BrkB/YihY/UPF0761 family membrane protein
MDFTKIITGIIALVVLYQIAIYVNYNDPDWDVWNVLAIEIVVLIIVLGLFFIYTSL